MLYDQILRMWNLIQSRKLLKGLYAEVQRAHVRLMAACALAMEPHLGVEKPSGAKIRSMQYFNSTHLVVRLRHAQRLDDWWQTGKRISHAPDTPCTAAQCLFGVV